jgi:hypothetical protein
MDFIERLVGFSPDGGSGVVEIVLLAALFLWLGVRAWRKIISRSAHSKTA